MQSLKKIKPCCLIFCSTEAGVYTLLFFNLIYCASLVVVGLVFSAWSWTILLHTNNSSDFKATTMIIWILYVIYFVCEVLLGRYLLKAVNGLDNFMCKFWIKSKYYLLTVLILMMCLHSVMHYKFYEIVAFTIILVFHAYYIWTVKYFINELEAIIESEQPPQPPQPPPLKLNKICKV